MITQPNQLPQQTHLAALVFKSESIYHEGDERSRTNPGHGYPAYTETVRTVEYTTFANKTEMEQWVIKAETTHPKPKYRLIEARPLTAKMSATVAIG